MMRRMTRKTTRLRKVMIIEQRLEGRVCSAQIDMLRATGVTVVIDWEGMEWVDTRRCAGIAERSTSTG